MKNANHKSTRTTNSWDAAGVFASSVCAVHCLASPVLVTLASSLGIPFLDDEVFHPVLASSVALIAFAAFRRGYFRHRNIGVIGLALFGGGIILFSAFNIGHFLDERSERALTLSGGLLISIGHIWNGRLIRRCQCCL